MRRFALMTILAAGTFSGSAEAHQFQVVNGSPSFFKFNTRRAASGVVQIKSVSDGSLAVRSRHTHCFNVTAGPVGVSAAVKKVCSSTLGLANITVRSSNVDSGWLRLEEIPNVQAQNQLFEIPLVFHDPLVASVKKTGLTAGECTVITIKGGVQPYSFSVLGDPTGLVNAQNEFCTELGAHGISTLLIRDSARNQAAVSLTVRGEVLSVSMDAQRWEVTSGRGVPIHPTSEQNGGWSLPFPDISEGYLGYLTQSTSMGYLKAKALIARFRIEMSPGAEFDHHTEVGNTSDYPAHVRFLLQRGASLTSAGNDRWWSNPLAVRLENGEFVLRVPLTPDQWTNVWAQRGNADATALQGFQTALDQIGRVGFTFGGGFFFGHGVRVKNGTATFILTGFDVEK